MRATEETSWRAIYQDREAYAAYRRNAMRYLRTLFLPKTTSSQQVQKEFPVDMVKSLLNIQLAKQPRFARLDTIVQTFASNEDRIQNFLPLTKALWGFEMIFFMTLLILLARTLAMIV